MHENGLYVQFSTVFSRELSVASVALNILRLVLVIYFRILDFIVERLRVDQVCIVRNRLLR